MAETTMENNRVSVTGVIASLFTYSHSIFGENFYLADLKVTRLSAKMDTIPILVSDQLINVKRDYRGSIVEVYGQFRSYNRREGDSSRLVLTVFTRELCFLEACVDASTANRIYLDGYICKEPVLRRTSTGRDIADLLLAVNRSTGRSDYIPCISWGRNARDASEFSVGARIRLWGRVQSRQYTKWLADQICERRTVYEVSISRMERRDLPILKALPPKRELPKPVPAV